MSSDTAQLVLSYTQDFLSHLGFGDEIQVQVQFDPDQDLYQISLATPNPALLIGFHGETLSSLQLVLAQHLHTATSQWLNLSLNVNDYKERRESALHSLADSTVNMVLQTSQPHALPPLPANERRIVHVYLAEHPQVSTSSEGVGRTRSVVISPK